MKHQESKKLLDLPDDILHKIINHLDTTSLIQTSETCKCLFKLTKANEKFQQIPFAMDFKQINMKEEKKLKFSKKLWKIIKNPLNWKEYTQSPMSMLRTIKKSARNYQIFKIQNLNEYDMNEDDFQKILKVLKRKGNEVKFLTISESTFSSNHGITKVIENFPKIQKIRLVDVDVKQICDIKPLVLGDLLDIRIKDCEPNVTRIFTGIKHIVRFTIHLETVQDRRNMMDFERFIFQQQKLEVLHLTSTRKSLIYLNFIAAFKLKELKFRNISFNDPRLALDFLHQQNLIQKLEVSLSSITTTEIPVVKIEQLLKFVFEKIEQLKELTINCNYNGYDMSAIHIKPNEKIEVLKFVMTCPITNKKLMNAVLKLTPKLKRFQFKEKDFIRMRVSPFMDAKFPPNVEELELHGGFDCLNDMNVPGDQFKTFKFVPRNPLRILDSQESILSDFLHRHPTIQNASLQHHCSNDFLTIIQNENLFPSLINLTVEHLTDVVASAVKLIEIIPNLENLEVSSRFEELTTFDLEAIKQHQIILSFI